MKKSEQLKALLANVEVLEQDLKRIIAETELEEAGASAENEADLFEEVYSLTTSPGFFKGKRPIAVIFPNGKRVATPTWKRLVETIIKRCNEDEAKHNGLMRLRNQIQGRDRTLLGSSVEGMRSPVLIDKGLYMETHYDTESLLRITTDRILDAVGYDYKNIKVAIRRK